MRSLLVSPPHLRNSVRWTKMTYYRCIPPRWRTVTLTNILRPRYICRLFVASLMIESPIQVLFGLSTRGASSDPFRLHNMSKKLIDRSVQTECEPPIVFPSKTKNKVGRPRKVSIITTVIVKDILRDPSIRNQVSVCLDALQVV